MILGVYMSWANPFDTTKNLAFTHGRLATVIVTVDRDLTKSNPKNGLVRMNMNFKIKNL
jgi:hypothetical protein